MANKNDIPLTDVNSLQSEVAYDDFVYREHFSLECYLEPDRSKESISIKTRQLSEERGSGMVYILVIEGMIFKIGSTIKAIEDRVQSYNCGKKEYRRNGTCSTTNYFVLQSILNIEKIVEVYTYYPEMKGYQIFGEEGSDRFPTPKIVEKKVLKEFKKRHGQLPIGCTQG
ncbi:MAG: GIY-YIG nuclease family protein [Cytophagales bacterium]|nr:GIY-YIG nuclease family protein [Cytophagales bacterium]